MKQRSQRTAGGLSAAQSRRRRAGRVTDEDGYHVPGSTINLLVEEDRRAPTAPLDHVMGKAGGDDAGNASHGSDVSEHPVLKHLTSAIQTGHERGRRYSHEAEFGQDFSALRMRYVDSS